MPGLIETQPTQRTHLRRRARKDGGAAATIVAVLLAGGVLLGMTALVVDVGQLYVEREELLSGADSAAMAIALDCAMDRPECAPEAAAAKAVDYASANARNEVANAIVCSNDSRLPPCDDAFDPRGNLTDCLGDRPGGIRFVEVRTTTLMPDGSTLLPPSFAQTLVAGYEGTEVGACSRVAWGAPAGGLAGTWSACEWDLHTQGGTVLAPPPPAEPDHSLEHVISFSTGTTQAVCDAGPSGFDAPGGFGWLEDDTGQCHTTVVDDEYDTDPAINITHACIAVLADARANKTVLAVPVYSAVQGVGANITYTLEGFAGFVVTGYNFPGPPPGGGGPPGGGPGPNNVASYLTGHTCHSSNACLIGYYVNGLIDSTEFGEGPIMGAVVVRTVG